MKRMAKAAVLIHLIHALRDRGSWGGETHVQKSVYLLQELFSIDLGFQFILYKHGPFSFDLRDELTALRADGVVALQPQRIPYGPRLAATEMGLGVQSRFPKTIEKYRHAVEFISERLGSAGVSRLERLATAVYVTRAHPDSSPQERASVLVDLKPHISFADAVEAIEEADEMLADAAAETVV